MQAFDTPGKTRLRVKNAAGLISVDPSETGRTTVVLEALREDDATREAIERATVELNGNEVTVEIGVGSKGFGVGPAWITFGRTPSVGIRIRCPEDSDLECTTASADVAATGRLGNVELKTASGDIAVEHVTALRVQSASGDVRAATVDGEARLQTVSGDVRLGTVTGSVSATLVSGDFSIDDAHTDLARRPSLATSGSARSGRGRSKSSRSRATSASASAPVRASGSTPTRRAATSAPSSTSRTRPRRDRAEARRGWRRRLSAATSRSPGPQPSQPDVRRPGGLWRHRDFLSLWGARRSASSARRSACWRCRSSRSSRSRRATFRVALLTTVEFLPFLLFTLPAGVWVDRLRRRPILILADLGRAAALVTVPVAYWLGVLSIWQLYAVGFATGICTVFFDVAYQSYLPGADRAGAGRRRQLEARDQPFGREHRRPRLAGLLVAA